MNVTIEREGCIGCGLCAASCPEVFRMADDGLAEVHGESSILQSVTDAADNCPVSVIHVEA